MSVLTVRFSSEDLGKQTGFNAIRPIGERGRVRRALNDRDPYCSYSPL